MRERGYGSRVMRSLKILRYSADRRTLAVIGGWYGLLALQWNWDDKPVWVTVLLLALTCAGAFLGAVSTHNAIHSPVFQARWMNNLWQLVLTCTYGHPVTAYMPGHNLSHHRHTETRRDAMRTSKARFGWNLLNLLFFAVVVSRSIMRAEWSYVRFALHRRPRLARQFMLEMAVWLGFMAVLFFFNWKKTLLFVIVPHQYAAWGIITMNILQHDGTDTDSGYNHSRNFVGKVINWFTFNNGYHAIHHLRPTLHWSLAPEYDAKYVVPRMDPRLDEPSLAAYLWRTYGLPGTRLRYDGKPVIPVDPGEDEEWFSKDGGTIPPTAGALTRAGTLRPRMDEPPPDLLPAH